MWNWRLSNKLATIKSDSLPNFVTCLVQQYDNVMETSMENCHIWVQGTYLSWRWMWFRTRKHGNYPVQNEDKQNIEGCTWIQTTGGWKPQSSQTSHKKIETNCICKLDKYNSDTISYCDKRFHGSFLGNSTVLMRAAGVRCAAVSWIPGTGEIPARRAQSLSLRLIIVHGDGNTFRCSSTVNTAKSKILFCTRKMPAYLRPFRGHAIA
jgi:hypothetical protein